LRRAGRAGKSKRGMSPRQDTPRIETSRLILRRYEEADFDALHAMASHAAMFRYSERGAMTREEVWTRLLRQVGHWALLGYGIFAVEEKETGRFVGEAGLGQFQRNLGDGFDGPPEITWSIAPDRQGRGYAFEAAQAALAWISQRMPGPTVCLIHVANAPSLRLAEKLGYRPLREIEYRGYPALLFRRAEP